MKLLIKPIWQCIMKKEEIVELEREGLLGCLTKEEKVKVRMEVNKKLNGLCDMEEGEIRDVDGERMLGQNDSYVEVSEDEEGEKEEDEYKMVK
ncbi:unnamed protein product [Dovyalis caffra]|uniref:Uncharacterized protein n=1 Tax=Dovyalis caffra TaxID=77055 RepID=A0AAV1RXL0_9ROSI|nr:unnamed protein product [Dovyalis caffra]